MIGISACLGGICCRYDGKMQKVNLLEELLESEKAVLICPEVMGNLPIPRVPAEIIGGDGFAVWQGKAKVINRDGEDVTEAFMQGAKLAYQKLKAQNIQIVILKERSPSCGKSMIYDGSFSGVKVKGYGVAAAYFSMQKIQVYSEEEVPELKRQGVL